MRCFVYMERGAGKITEKAFFIENFIFLNTHTSSYTLLASRQMTWPKTAFLNSLPLLLPSSVSQEINLPLVMSLQNPVCISLTKAHKTL